MKAECATSLLQSSVSHDPSESDAQKTFMIIINVENCCDAYFLEIVIGVLLI